MKEITSMKINLHCHSNYSDSYVSILEMAQEHQKLGFSAFVVTDHCYPFLIKEGAKNKRSITSFDQFCEQNKELEMASKKLDYPCIQGIELALFEEEVLVFGTDTIKKIFEYANNSNTKYLEKYGEFNSYHKVLSKKIANILKENKKDTAIILCHPRLLSKNQWEQNIIFNLIDGYEFQNNRTYHFSDETNLEAKYKWERPIPPELMNKKKFYNSDAHILKQISNAEGNFHSSKICTLDDLIKFIKTPTLNISMVNQKIIQDSKQKS